jgi:hypothetical protein
VAIRDGRRGGDGHILRRLWRCRDGRRGGDGHILRRWKLGGHGNRILAGHNRKRDFGRTLSSSPRCLSPVQGRRDSVRTQSKDWAREIVLLVVATKRKGSRVFNVILGIGVESKLYRLDSTAVASDNVE